MTVNAILIIYYMMEKKLWKKGTLLIIITPFPNSSPIAHKSH